jgi:hypothetical protein
MTADGGAPGRGAVRRAWGSMRRHPLLATVFAVAAIALVVLGDLVGLAIFITVGLLVLVGLVAVAIGRRLAARRGGSSPPITVASVVVAAVVVGVAIQAVPFGRAHSNGAITGEPAWADARTRDLVVRACYDCHSNEVEFPWYSSVAPVSWAVELHVNDGRRSVNYSTFATDPGDADESVEVVLDGSMPPGYFTRFGLHLEAKLTDAELDELVRGLRATPGMSDDD